MRGQVRPVTTISGSSWRLSKIATAYLAVALIHLFVLLFLHTLSVQLGRGGFSFVTVGGDDGYFHYETARSMVSTGNLSSGGFAVFLTAWPSVMAYFMLMAGTTDILVTKVLLFLPNLILLLGALALFDVLDAGVSDAQERSATKVKLLFGIGLYPSLLSFSYGSLYRDAWIYCLFLLATLLLAILWAKTSLTAKVTVLILSPMLLYALYKFREYAAAALIAGCAIWLVSVFFQAIVRRLTGDRRARIVMLWLLHLALAGVLAAFFWLSPLAEAISAYRKTFSTIDAGSNLGLQLDLTSPVQTILVFPYSFVSNVLGPLPWQVTSAASVLNFLLEVPVLLAVTVALFKRRRSLTRLDWLVLSVCLAYFVIIALANDNVGTAARLRVVGWLPIFVVYAKLICQDGRTRSEARLAA